MRGMERLKILAISLAVVSCNGTMKIWAPNPVGGMFIKDNSGDIIHKMSQKKAAKKLGCVDWDDIRTITEEIEKFRNLGK